MPTPQELLDYFGQLTPDDRLFFLDRVKKSRSTEWVEFESSIRQKEKDKLYSQIDTSKNALIAMENANAELKQKLAAFETAPEKTEKDSPAMPMDDKTAERMQQLEDALKQTQETARAANLRALRAEVFADIKVPKAFQKFVGGETEEEIRTQATEILESFNAQAEERVNAFKAEHDFESLVALKNAPPPAPAPTPEPAPAAAPAAPAIDALAAKPYDNLVVTDPAIGSPPGQLSDITAEQVAAMSDEEFTEHRKALLSSSRQRLHAPLIPKN